MANNIKLLLHDISINITIYDDIGIRDVLVLKDLYSHSNTTFKLDSNLLISHLCELGLVTYNQTFSDFDHDYQAEQTQVKVPNREIYKIIFNKLRDHYIEKYDLPSSLKSVNYPAFMKFFHSFWKISKNPCKEYLGVFLDSVQNNFGRLFLTGFRNL